MAFLIERVKQFILPINTHLLKLKLCFFLAYSIIFSSMPYVSILSTQLIDYQQLSVLFACGTVVSTVGPVFIGFLADKFGNYKTITLCGILLAGFVHLPMLWLDSSYEHRRGYRLANSSSLDLAQSTNSNLSSAEQPTHEQSPHVFPVLLLIRLLGFIGIDITCVMVDASGLTLCKKHGGDFGRQKMWSNFSMVCVPVVCGALVDAVSDYLGYVDYSIAFYVCALIAALLVGFIFRMEIQVQKNERSMLETARVVVKMIDVNVFFFAQVVLGVCLGFHLTFFSVYVEEQLQSSKTLFGLALTVAGIGSMVTLSVVQPIVNRFGAVNTLAFCLMMYCARFVLFNFLENPWIILVSESLDGMSGFLGFAAGSYFCAAAASPGMLASLNGILGASTFGAGRGIGTAVGSLLISAYGMRLTYLFIGLLSGTTSILYLAAYHLCLKKVEQKRLSSST